MKNFLHYIRKSMYLQIFALMMFVLAFILDTPAQIVDGLYQIIKSTGILITDYIAVGGIGATLVNASVMLMLNLLLVKQLKLRLSGILYAAIMMILGYSFYGKNILNTLPIYLGVLLYSRANKINFKNLIIVLLFSSGIAPLVSYTMFGFDMKLYLSIPLGIVVGVVSGFIIPALASHTMKFHQGYSVFNVGFALGIVSIFFNALYKAFGLTVSTASLVSKDYHWLLFGILSFIAVFYIIMAFVCEPKVLLRFKELFKRSGRLISDFERDFGVETVILNTAMLIILELLVILIFRIRLDGAIFGTILAVAGFAGAGLHLRNTFFVLAGAIIMNFIIGKDITATSSVCAIFFSLGLAPICGRYGIFAGLVAGALHVILVPLTLSFQGGFVLYNNGFASCFVACIMIALIEALKEQE